MTKNKVGEKEMLIMYEWLCEHAEWDSSSSINQEIIQAIRAAIEERGRIRGIIEKADDAIKRLMKACDTLMDEVVRKKSSDWGAVNDGLAAGREFLNKIRDFKLDGEEKDERGNR